MNVGIIGLGYWGKHYVRLVNNNSKMNLIALCDVNKNNLDKFSYLNINFFTNYEELFKKNLIDTVIIVTIAKEHYKIILKALEYNLNIFVEKPIVTHLDECIKIKQLSSTFLIVSKVEATLNLPSTRTKSNFKSHFLIIFE